MKNEYIYLYNNSFVSLLSLIYNLLKNNVIPFNIKDRDYQNNLFDITVYLKVDEDEEIIERIKEIFGKSILTVIYYVFSSNEENKEIIIYYFLRNTIKFKNKIFYRRDLKCVREVLRIFKYVKNEVHKYKGFLRFKELNNGVLYAEGDFQDNIISFLAKHFSKRLSGEYWIIKDVKRNIYCLYDRNDYYFVDESNFLLDKDFSKEENSIEDLWKNFYKTIGIKERKNLRCRRNFMPKKYWKYIIEVSDENEKGS